MLPFHSIFFPFILLAHFPPSPVLGKCIGSEWDEPYSEECLDFCDSKRKEGHAGEFEADCGNPYSSSATDQDYQGAVVNTCRWSCAKHKCPCYSCPNGNYVVCPPVSSLSAARILKLKKLLKSKSSKRTLTDTGNDDGLPLTLVAVIVLCVILAFIMIGLLGAWIYWHFSQKRVRQPDIVDIIDNRGL